MIGGRRVIGVIPARAGSLRLPGKNLRPLAGRPMIQWTLDAARGASLLDRIVVTSDDPGVLEIARAAGSEAIRRPDALSGPEASVTDAIEHALEQVGGDWDYVVLLQPTSPLRLTEDIDGAVRLCDETDAPGVISVSPMAKPPGFHDRLDAAGRLTGAPDLDNVILINGAVYVGRPEILFRERTFRVAGVQAYEMPVERAADVDTLADFLACEAYLTAADRRIL